MYRSVASTRSVLPPALNALSKKSNSVGVPAQLTTPSRTALRQAAASLGLQSVTLLTEPSFPDSYIALNAVSFDNASPTVTKPFVQRGLLLRVDMFMCCVFI